MMLNKHKNVYIYMNVIAWHDFAMPTICLFNDSSKYVEWCRGFPEYGRASVAPHAQGNRTPHSFLSNSHMDSIRKHICLSASPPPSATNVRFEYPPCGAEYDVSASCVRHRHKASCGDVHPRYVSNKNMTHYMYDYSFVVLITACKLFQEN